MPIDHQDNDTPATPAERGDALHTIKMYARASYLQAGAGTEEEFEELWRVAFYADEAKHKARDQSTKFQYKPG